MANRKLPPNLYARQYRTKGGYKQTLYYVRFKDWTGKRRTFAAGADFDHAKAELARLKLLDHQKHDFGAAEPKPAMLFDWVEKYLKAKAANPATLQRYTFATAKLKAGLGDIGLDAISHTLLLEYRERRRADVTDATINREMLSLRSILRMAYHDRALERLPRMPFEQEHNERTRTIDDGEYARILKALPIDDREFCEIIREMGFRPAEILEIAAADLRPQSRSIDMSRIRKKRGLKRELPLSPRAWKILAARSKRAKPGARLFDFSRHQARTAFMRACAKLGIKDVWLYDLKATFATEKQREGWPDKIIQEFTGHRSSYAFRRYSRPTADDLKSFIVGRSGLKWQRRGNKRASRQQPRPVRY